MKATVSLLRVSLLLVTAPLLLGACKPQNGGAAVQPSAESAGPSEAARGSRASIEVEGDPTVGDATVLVYLLDDGEDVSGAQVEVSGDMTHAGVSTNPAAPTGSGCLAATGSRG